MWPRTPDASPELAFFMPGSLICGESPDIIHIWCFRLTGGDRWPTSSRGRGTKKGLYLQIYKSHWDPERRHSMNKSVKALGC